MEYKYLIKNDLIYDPTVGIVNNGTVIVPLSQIKVYSDPNRPAGQNVELIDKYYLDSNPDKFKGPKGDTGHGIVSTSFDRSTDEIVFTYEDGTTFRTGSLRGPIGSNIRIVAAISDRDNLTPNDGDLVLVLDADGYNHPMLYVWVASTSTWEFSKPTVDLTIDTTTLPVVSPNTSGTTSRAGAYITTGHTTTITT